jgi:hypothetical protein
MNFQDQKSSLFQRHPQLGCMTFTQKTKEHNMNTIKQKLLNYVQKNYDDLQYDRGLFHWLMILFGFLSFALPVYLFATDQTNLLAIIFLCVSPIGLFFWDLTETKQKISFFGGKYLLFLFLIL